jgi:hypothetical protein
MKNFFHIMIIVIFYEVVFLLRIVLSKTSVWWGRNLWAIIVSWVGSAVLSLKNITYKKLFHCTWSTIYATISKVSLNSDTTFSLSNSFLAGLTTSCFFQYFFLCFAFNETVRSASSLYFPKSIMVTIYTTPKFLSPSRFSKCLTITIQSLDFSISIYF